MIPPFLGPRGKYAALLPAISTAAHCSAVLSPPIRLLLRSPNCNTSGCAAATMFYLKAVISPILAKHDDFPCQIAVASDSLMIESLTGHCQACQNQARPAVLEIMQEFCRQLLVCRHAWVTHCYAVCASILRGVHQDRARTGCRSPCDKGKVLSLINTGTLLTRHRDRSSSTRRMVLSSSLKASPTSKTEIKPPS